MKKILLGLIVILCVAHVDAQDIHYSQFYNSPLNFNPANTGVFNGDKRINLSYRSQWRSVPVPWTTFSGSFDRKFLPKGDTDNFFSLGGVLNYDRQGDVAGLSLINIQAMGSYSAVLNPNNILTFGLGLGYSNRGYDQNSLTWDSQWSGIAFDPTLPTNEQLNVDRLGFMETSIGVNYRWQQSRRTKMDLGIGVLHLVEPSTDFLDNSPIAKLPRRLSLGGVGSFEVTNALDIQLHAIHQIQKETNELVFGGVGKIYINQQRGKELELHIGAGYRTSKSLFPILAVQYQNFYGAINYDVNTADFGAFGGRGRRPSSFEMHFNYIITDVKPLRRVKVCPIY